MRTILIQPDVKGVDEFRKILLTNLSDFNVVTSIDDVETHNIEVVIMWFYAPDFLRKLPNLKLILTCGSGVDHIIDSPNLPHNIPLIRLVDPFLRDHVSNYVVEQVFKYLFPEMEHIVQEEVLLKSLETTEYRKPTVGIMGLGLVGSSTAEKLINIGFEVCGWVNSSKPRFLKEVYVGIDELADFAKKCEIIVCQLPLTKKTKGILNSHLFGLLPNGAFLINVGRGAHLVEADLLFALDIGKLSGACLDVFEIEPLPLSHPFHANPKIKITPHIAGYVGPETQAPYATQIIASYYENKNAMGLVDYLSHY